MFINNWVKELSHQNQSNWTVHKNRFRLTIFLFPFRFRWQCWWSVQFSPRWTITPYRPKRTSWKLSQHFSRRAASLANGHRIRKPIPLGVRYANLSRKLKFRTIFARQSNLNQRKILTFPKLLLGKTNSYKWNWDRSDLGLFQSEKCLVDVWQI